MQWFNDLRIRVKLILSFLILAVFTAVVGIIGISNMYTIDQRTEDMYYNNYLPVQDLTSLQRNLLFIRSNFLLMVYEKDTSKLQQRIEEINKWTAEDNDFLKRYEPTIQSEEERALFNTINENLAPYRQIRTEALRLVQEGKYNEAAAMVPEFAKAREKVDSSVANLIAYNTKMAQKTSETNAAEFKKQSLMMAAIIIFVALLAIILGVFISNIIGKPLIKLVSVADQISAGNINVDVAANSKDEVGKLMSAFDKVIKTLQELVMEQSKLAKAASEGKLDVRGDSEKFKGSYREIINGVNNTLDAVIEPIKESSAVLNEMSKGNLKARVVGNYKGDHADIKEALNHTTETISSYIDEISQILTEMADGNMTGNVSRDYVGDFYQIKNSLNQIIDAFNRVLNDINTAAQQVASGARQVSDSSQMLSQGATEQASSVEELTASLEEISSQTKQNALNANQASEMALTAKEDAVNGNERMKEMLKAMNDIHDASSSISKIIKVIDEIAFQTNILALNAAVEAARAGQHGKGFAVVAEEVRNLAARSANAAKETTVLIEGSIKKTETGTKIANETADALSKMVEVVTNAASLVREIATASNEQALGIAQVNQGIMQVSQVVQTNSATSEEGAAASEELSSQAELLKDLVGRFRLKRSESGFNGIDGINPEILRMLENMNESKSNERAKRKGKPETNVKPKIVLGGSEFGKY
ncbi:MAG: methyl-accepting chemotaxis protein [Clostridia bacterium]|nr:methyl-accepting chemotaxis protein [Clostridia bacterium]